ncbi:MAG TPA: type II and III secretion system protein family protein [Xanthobacteraceae bacterium]|nr:type II and III secretion system protein family protein [Xanthobacteraceae bacterium]
MASRRSIRVAPIAAWVAAVAIAWFGAAPGTRASDLRIDAKAPEIHVAAADSGSRFVPLGVGKSVVVDLPRDVKDVLVADPKIANAVVRSSRRAYLIGVAVGQTNVFFFDADGRQIAGFDIAVKRDLNGIRAALRQTFPGADIRIEGIGDGVMLSGAVSSPAESQQAFDIATRLVGGDPNKVVNGLAVKGRDQVMLKVTVAEVQRDLLKQLGIDLNGTLGTGSTVVNFSTANPFSAFGSPINPGTGLTANWNNVSATLRAMERAGVIRTLAEPTLTAISGESATFLAGGEFPIPAGLSCDTTKNPPVCQAQVDFKKFGVSMNFTPVVLSEGRISLKVMTEVSDLSTDNAMTLQQAGSTLTIPSIRVRRADTTVEIPSGGALAMAGMIQEQTKQAINGIPGLMQVPVLGTLFRSRDFINRQTELMVLVTPYVVRSVAQKDLSRPDDGFADAGDPAAAFLGRLNRIYGIAGRIDPNLYHGKYGFILD